MIAIRARAVSCAILCLIATGPAVADPAADLSRSIAEALGTEETQALRAAADADMATATTEEIETFLPQMVAMGRLAQTAESDATRVLMTDLHRQLLENIVADPESAETVRMVEAANPIKGEIVLGSGMAASDLEAAGYLEALARSVPEDPTQAELDRDALLAAQRETAARFEEETPINRQFIARLDAWLAGTLQAWPGLTEAQRREAAMVTTRAELPAPEVIEAVIGTRDLVLWLGAMDVALTEAERAAHPGLVRFLEEGNLSAGATDMILARMRAAGAGSAGGLAAQRNLNHELLWGDLSGGSVAGDIMGLE